MNGKIRQSGAVTVLLCLCLCVLSSCARSEYPTTRENESQTQETAEPIAFGMYEKDALVPYDAETRLNRETLTLCYNGLISLDSTWTANAELASEWKTDGNTVTVTIRGDALFSDGSPVTAADCVYSYSLAKKGASAYASYFSYITSYEAVDTHTFAVTFAEESLYSVNFLDIPIVKSGTGNDTFAVGAGYYYLKTSPSVQTGEDMYKMYRNSFCCCAPEGLPEVLDVILLDSTEDLLYAFNYGGVDILYNNLSSGSVRYRTNAETVTYTSNSLTYAVVNTKKTRLSYGKRNYIADALTKLISREALTQDILNGCGVATWVPFNPSWSKMKEAQFVEDCYSEAESIASFRQGRWYQDKTTGFLEWYGDDISLTVIAEGDNVFEVETAEYLTERLNALGVQVTTVLLSESDYEKACKNGEYDIRIETAEISRDMNLLDLFEKANVKISDTLKQAVQSFNRGESSIYEVNAAFQSEMPLIPLYYTSMSLSVNTRVSGTFAPAPGNLLDGIETWKIEK